MKKLQLTSLMLISLLSGCASVHQTFISKENDSTHGQYGYKSKVYAGTKTDASTVSICFAGTGWEFITCPFALLAAIDMPFSFAADTLFLPYTIPNSISNSTTNKQLHLQKPENEMALVNDFVKNNKEVMREAGGIKNIKGTYKKESRPKVMQNRYEVAIEGYGSKSIYAVVGVSRSTGDAEVTLECISHLAWGYRVVGKDACAQ